MKIDKKTLSWLTTVPSGDINFRMRLIEANVKTLKKALEDKGLSKTARRMIESQIKRIEKNGI